MAGVELVKVVRECENEPSELVVCHQSLIWQQKTLPLQVGKSKER